MMNWPFRRIFNRTKPESKSGRTWCDRIDGDPNIKIRPANVVYVCDNCLRLGNNPDPPELIVVYNQELNSQFYQVRCPLCWQHTEFYESEEDAEQAWNRKDRHKLLD